MILQQGVWCNPTAEVCVVRRGRAVRRRFKYACFENRDCLGSVQRSGCKRCVLRLRDIHSMRRQHGYTGKIVAVTASVMKSDTALSTESGCNGFIPKPIGDDFGDIIAEFLKGESNG